MKDRLVSQARGYDCAVLAPVCEDLACDQLFASLLPAYVAHTVCLSACVCVRPPGFPIRQGALHVRKGYPELVIPSSQDWGIELQNRALTYPFFSVSFSIIFLSPHFGQITIFRILAM